MNLSYYFNYDQSLTVNSNTINFSYSFFNVRNLTSENEDFYKEDYAMSNQISKEIKNEDSTINKKTEDPTINTPSEKEPNRNPSDTKSSKGQEIIAKPTIPESPINPNKKVKETKKVKIDK